MSQSVRAFDLNIAWESNAPEAVLVANDSGATSLTLRAREDDPDQRSIVLVWAGSWASRMEPQNDEALTGNPLYKDGLKGVTGIGEVLESRLIANLEKRDRFHPKHVDHKFGQLRHWVVPLKNALVEVVAETIEVQRQ